MRKGTLFIVVAVCTLIGWTPRAEASGVNLRCDACLADGGSANRSFACNLNTGAVTLVPSFSLGTPCPGSSGSRVRSNSPPPHPCCRHGGTSIRAAAERE